MVPIVNARFRPLVAVAAVLFAGWSVVTWMVSRSIDESDEPLGILSLAVAAWFLIEQRHTLRVTIASLVIAALLLTAMVLLPLPHLLQATALFAATGVVLRLWKKPGIAFLLLLSVPWVSSMQFYLGYPMRRWAGMFSELLLRLVTIDVSLQGTDLLYRGELVGVDPPCSGVRMLWFAMFAGAVLTARFGLRMHRAWVLGVMSVGLVILANGLRAAILFFPESGMIELPHWTHEAVGVLVFGLAIWPLFGLARRWSLPSVNDPAVMATWSWVLAFVIACGCIAGLQVMKPAVGSDAAAATPEKPWPHTFDGIPISLLPRGGREEAFAANFPGRIARFQMGEDEIILRQVTRATRMLHSSLDCLRAAGWLVERTGTVTDADRRPWARFEARREGAVVEVLEQIRDAKGGHETDVSAWFWSALFHPEAGPWFACTRFRVLKADK